jgi:hypothetical protein
MRNEFLLKEERMRKTGKKKQNAPTPPPPRPPKTVRGGLGDGEYSLVLMMQEAGMNGMYVCIYVCTYVCNVRMYVMGEPEGREGEGRGGEDGRAGERVLRHFKGEMAPSPPRTPPSAAGPPRFPGMEGRRGARE